MSTSLRDIVLLHRSEAGTPNIHLALSAQLENRSARHLPSRAMVVLGAFNLRVCARAGFGGLYAPRGGTVFLWAATLSAVVPSVSSHRQNCDLRENTCGLSRSEYVQSCRAGDCVLRVMTGRARFLIKNNGIPSALQ